MSCDPFPPGQRVRLKSRKDVAGTVVRCELHPPSMSLHGPMKGGWTVEVDWDVKPRCRNYGSTLLEAVPADE